MEHQLADVAKISNPNPMLAALFRLLMVENSSAYGNLVRSFARLELRSCSERAWFAQPAVACVRGTKN